MTFMERFTVVTLGSATLGICTALLQLALGHPEYGPILFYAHVGLILALPLGGWVFRDDDDDMEECS